MLYNETSSKYAASHDADIIHYTSFAYGWQYACVGFLGARFVSTTLVELNSPFGI